MRVKIQGTIVEDGCSKDTNYCHEMYSMILFNLSKDNAKIIHEKKRVKRLFTFSKLYINNYDIHFYISGEDKIIKDFINCIMFNQIIRIGDKVINVKNISPLTNLRKKEEYIFKTDFIINEMKNKKVCLSENKEYIKRRILEIAQDKYKIIYDNENLNGFNIDIMSMKQVYTKYKNHHLNSYKSTIKIVGDYDLINLLYNVGIGENTASGHGFVWEVS